MAQIFRTVVGNSAPDLVFTCKRNSVVIDLSAAGSVSLAIRRDRDQLTTNSANQACTIGTPSSSGVVTYPANTTDYPDEGRYLGDVKITYNSGKVEHLRELLVMVARPAVS